MDLAWLERSFHKLLLNFTWWVNRKDRAGNNAFEGGFLGLDNIGVFDRSAPLPTGGYLEQADGTAWMALFCQNMLQISVELALERPAYAEMALKFLEHFLWISSALLRPDPDRGMWDEEDGFFYDVLLLPDGRSQRLKVRSMVGLLPLCAVTVFEGKLVGKYPELIHRFQRFLEARPELTRADPRPEAPGRGRPDARVGPRRDEAAPRARQDARRERVPRARTESGRCPASTPSIRSSSAWASRSSPSPTCPPSPTRGCSAATRTGADRSGCRSTR